MGSSRRILKKDLKPEGIPFFRGTEVGRLAEGKGIEPSLFIDEKQYEEVKSATGVPQLGDILLPSICPDGRVWLVDTNAKFYLKDARVLWLKPKREIILPPFLRYALSYQLIQNYEKYASGGSFAELKIASLRTVEIPVPSLETQQRIVDILDRFDSLTTSLTDGLPAEIAARRQQYEHYRDRLLTFPRKDS